MLLALDAKGVRDVAGSETIPTWAKRESLISDDDGQVPLDHIERLVLSVVDVPWGGQSSRGYVLDKGEPAPCLITGGLDPGRRAEEPAGRDLLGSRIALESSRKWTSEEPPFDRWTAAL